MFGFRTIYAEQGTLLIILGLSVARRNNVASVYRAVVFASYARRNNLVRRFWRVLRQYLVDDNPLPYSGLG